MKVTVRQACESDLEVVSNLFQYYVYDMSEYMGWNPAPNGKFAVNSLLISEYWTRDEHYPLLIFADDELAGFSLLRRYPDDSIIYDIGQFFILRKFKGQGIGREAFRLSVTHFPGQWLTRVLIGNDAALKFWTAVIGEITNGEYRVTQEQDFDLTMHFIRYEI